MFAAFSANLTGVRLDSNGVPGRRERAVQVATVVLACAACGTENRDEARFCGGCGSPLQTTAEPRDQRKTVTVVFSDLVGSTALGERLDAEALRALLARYFDRMRAIVERHGGTVEKFIGDAVDGGFRRAGAARGRRAARGAGGGWRCRR